MEPFYIVLALCHPDRGCDKLDSLWYEHSASGKVVKALVSGALIPRSTQGLTCWTGIMPDIDAPIDDAIDKAKKVLLAALLEARSIIMQSLSGHEVTGAPYGIDVVANAGLDWHSIQLSVHTSVTWTSTSPESSEGGEDDSGDEPDLSALDW